MHEQRKTVPPYWLVGIPAMSHAVFLCGAVRFMGIIILYSNISIIYNDKYHDLIIQSGNYVISIFGKYYVMPNGTPHFLCGHSHCRIATIRVHTWRPFTEGIRTIQPMYILGMVAIHLKGDSRVIAIQFLGWSEYHLS